MELFKVRSYTPSTFGVQPRMLRIESGELPLDAVYHLQHAYRVKPVVGVWPLMSMGVSIFLQRMLLAVRIGATYAFLWQLWGGGGDGLHLGGEINIHQRGIFRGAHQFFQPEFQAEADLEGDARPGELAHLLGGRFIGVRTGSGR